MYKLKSNYIKLDQSSRLHNSPLPIIGLTGGIATGKSTSASILAEKGLFVIDADQLIKEIYTQDETIFYIKDLAPTAVENNEINFKVLRELFFNNKMLKKDIETFLYQQMPARFLKKVQENSTNCHFIIYDVPLLFEKELHKLVDLSVVIYAKEKTQKNRLAIRDNSSSELIDKIIDQQIPIEEKKTFSDFVIDNNSDLISLEHKIQEFISLITDS